MQTFDFIEHADFRKSLETDYKDMAHCLEGKAWKSVQVLAGSIVEAMLVDYLVAAKYAPPGGKDVLKFDLAEAVTACKGQKVISDRTADLCSVIRSYRNLIHPARAVRLQEQAPDENSATVAYRLIQIIANELAKAREEKVGMTAEQILQKVCSDANSLSILKHLLEATSEKQRRALLLELIPTRHQGELEFGEDSFVAARLEKAFVTTYEACGSQTQELAVEALMTMIRQGGSDDNDRHISAFFGPHMFPMLKSGDRQVVLDYVLGRANPVYNFTTLKFVKGFEDLVGVADVQRWIDPYVRTMVNASDKDLIAAAERQLTNVFDPAWTPVQTEARKRLQFWFDRYKQMTSFPAARIQPIKDILDYIDLWA